MNVFLKPLAENKAYTHGLLIGILLGFFVGVYIQKRYPILKKDNTD